MLDQIFLDVSLSLPLPKQPGPFPPSHTEQGMTGRASTWQGACTPPSQPPWEICGPGWEEGSPPCPGGAQSLVFCALHRLQNETAAHEVLESIQSYFESQPFDFRGAQIISGQEEGVYGWITANYIMGNFLEVCGRNAWFLSSQCIPSPR